MDADTGANNHHEGSSFHQQQFVDSRSPEATPLTCLGKTFVTAQSPWREWGIKSYPPRGMTFFLFPDSVQIQALVGTNGDGELQYRRRQVPNPDLTERPAQPARSSTVLRDTRSNFG